MKYVNLMHAHPVAVAYIQNYLSKHDLKLGTLDDENFKMTMDIIMKAMLEAWIDGFETARQ